MSSTRTRRTVRTLTASAVLASALGASTGVARAAEAVPTIKGVTHTAGNVTSRTGSLAGGERAHVNGLGLDEVTAVYFGDRPATVIAVSSTRVDVTTPPGSLGPVDVTVVTPTATSAITPADRFTYVKAPSRFVYTDPGRPAAGDDAGITVGIRRSLDPTGVVTMSLHRFDAPGGCSPVSPSPTIVSASAPVTRADIRTPRVALTEAGSYVWELAYAGDEQNAAAQVCLGFNVVPAAFTSLLVTPRTATIAPGELVTYPVRAVDRFDNRQYLTADDAVTLSVDGGGSCVYFRCTATAPGLHLVTATFAGLSTTAVLRVTAVPPPS